MNLLDLFIKIGVKDEASGPIQKLTSSLGKGLKVAAAAGAAAVTASASAVGVLGKKAIDSYKDYQQLIGGVETLFKDSADIVQKNASRAFETAGLSANEYMETVTSFSAGLLQSLGGDTAKAAQVSDMAITDMADNANKMGTSMEAIQNAYQGFAKQNYTMLDNLKLGYGGTKSEMERLLADAEKFSGVHYDIDNLADVYEAIHVIQTEMDITGTTAKEAATTISGSFGMLKGAWSNFLGGLADKDANMDELIDNLISSAETVLANIEPVIMQFLQSIGNALIKLGPILAEKLPAFLQSLLPTLIKAAVALIVALGEAMPGILSALWEAIKVAGQELWPVLQQAFGSIGAWFGSKFGEAWAAIKAAFSSVGAFFSELWDTIKEKFSALGTKIGDAISGAVKAGINGLVSSIEGVINNAIQLINGAIGLINKIPGVSVGTISDVTFPRLAGGRDFVPYDNYPAMLHRGEAVLTAREADQWRRGEGSSRNIVNNFNFYGVSQSDLDWICAYVNRSLA